MTQLPSQSSATSAKGAAKDAPLAFITSTQSKRGKQQDRLTAIMVALCGLLVVVLVAFILGGLIFGSIDAMATFGWKVITSSQWSAIWQGHFMPDGSRARMYGGLTSIVDTLVTTAIAMLFAVPLSLMISLFLVELAPKRLASVMGSAIELLAAIPSIIFGMWGLFIFAPFMAQTIEPWLKNSCQHIWLLDRIFEAAPQGQDVLVASLILALMILPYMTAITRDVMAMVPAVLRESAYGMGSTTWEVTRRVTVPYGARGIIGAAFIALSRALGETMAVTMVIGGSSRLSASLLSPGNTIASTLANDFNEAAGHHLSALIELALVLFVITILAQVAAYGLLAWTRRSVH